MAAKAKKKMVQSLSLNEIELLATILQRAGVNQVEAAWVNGLLNKLRLIAAQADLAEIDTRTQAKDPNLDKANSALR